MSTEFRALLKKHRIDQGFGLRAFAEHIGEQPGNYCGVENGSRKPWRSREKLVKVANALSLTENSKEWDEFFIAAGHYEEVKKLLQSDTIPVLLRTIEQAKLSPEQLKRLAEKISSGDIGGLLE